jgi:hypothetical protein
MKKESYQDRIRRELSKCDIKDLMELVQAEQAMKQVEGIIMDKRFAKSIPNKLKAELLKIKS